MRTETTTRTLYVYDELSDAAKAKARDWYREGAFEYDWWDGVYDDAATVAELFGLDLRTRRVQARDGTVRYKPNISFSGFWSQGDGACFEGTYRYKKGALKAVMEYAPKDTDLHYVVRELQRVQRKHFYRLTASTKHRGHYCHSGCMSVEADDCDYQYKDLNGAEDVVRSALREFADWIYKRLEAEYDYQNSDEAVEESIVSNEYEFLEDGSRA